MLITLPEYLYHATSKENAVKIARSCLKPRSTGRLLCMSGKEEGVTTLSPRAVDIIFRVKTIYLISNHWTKSGAGKDEWRSHDTIPNYHLEFNFFLRDNGGWKNINDLLVLTSSYNPKRKGVKEMVLDHFYNRSGLNHFYI